MFKLSTIKNKRLLTSFTKYFILPAAILLGQNTDALADEAEEAPTRCQYLEDEGNLKTERTDLHTEGTCYGFDCSGRLVEVDWEHYFGRVRVFRCRNVGGFGYEDIPTYLRTGGIDDALTDAPMLVWEEISCDSYGSEFTGCGYTEESCPSICTSDIEIIPHPKSSPYLGCGGNKSSEASSLSPEENEAVFEARSLAEEADREAAKQYFFKSLHNNPIQTTDQCEAPEGSSNTPVDNEL